MPRIRWEEEIGLYPELSSAKRGAERLLDRFLREAGLVPAGEAIRIKPAKIWRD